MKQTKSIHLKSYGCSLNMGEGEIINGLIQNDYTVAQTDDDADMIILNVCTVKGNSEIVKRVRKLRAEYPHKKIVLSGCVTKELGRLVHEVDPSASLTTTNNLNKIANTISETFEGSVVEDFKVEKQVKVNKPKVRTNPVVGIVPVSAGCLDNCSFCSTVLVKGKHYSYPVKNILEEVEACIADGCKEIWLTGQDAACYGFDIDTNLAKLVTAVIALPGDFMVRIGMGNPRHLLSYIDELIEAMKHPKVFKFIHLSVQSGSNTVLESMKRKHSVEDYIFLVDTIRKEIPELTLSTDIIVGFPGETEQDFEDTLNLIRSTKPSVCNRTRFVPREKTAAQKFPDQIHIHEKKNRSRILTEEFKKVAFENNKKWVNWEGTIVIDEISRQGDAVGRNSSYKPVVLKSTHALGEKIKVRVTTPDIFGLFAEIIPE
ncbi:MAG: tRNA (N(6)-L-threonylcarbamoyladenosine(37)-C(2))-methylthiotransferase [Fibrobacterales bacterium]